MSNKKFKIYIATFMNGKEIKQIEKTIGDYCEKLESKGYDYVNPFDKKTAEEHQTDGIVIGYKPIEMLGASLQKMEGCDGITFVGTAEEFDLSRGVKIEVLTALIYGLEVKFYDPETDEHKYVDGFRVDILNCDKGEKLNCKS